MPRINRVRLINYGWANRRIDDLILDFHGGLNTEIRLGNGGGKSVLQRLIYQAVYPNTTISGNRIEDYLKNKPAMTVIEWLSDTKDSEPELFTTGVLLSKSEARDENNATVYFFTFVSNDSRHLSIDHLPNVEHESGILEIESYTVSQNKYRNLSVNYPEIFYYQSQDRKKYHQKLEEFGISVNTWNEIIRKMIEAEDPFSAFLKNYKTEDQLINGYLLPNIETHLSRTGDNKSFLRTQLKDNVEKMAEQKESRAMRDLLVSFLKDREEESSLLDVLAEKKQAHEKTIADLSGLLSAAVRKTQELQTAGEELSKQMEHLQAGLEKIHRERVSHEYNQARIALSHGEETLQEVENALHTAKEAEEEIRNRRSALYARQIYDEIETVKGRIDALQEQYRGLEQSQEKQLMTRISATLYQRYEEEITALKEKETELQNRIAQAESSGRDLQELLRKKETLRNRNEKETGVLEEKKQQAEQKETDLQEQLNITLRRDFLNQLMEEDIEASRKELDRRVSVSGKEVEKLRAAIAQAAKTFNELTAKKEEAIRKTAELKASEARAEEEKSRFETRRKQLVRHMERYGLETEQMYRHEELRKECQRRIQENEHHCDQIKYEIQLRQELIASAEKGSVYIPDNLSSMLAKGGISFETGENFLRKQKLQDRKSYLKKRPMLPFALLMNRQNYEKLQNSDFHTELIRQIIPVYLYGELDRKLSVSEEERWLCQVKEELLDEKRRKIFLESMEQKKQEDCEQLEGFVTERKTLSAFETAVKEFTYDQGFEKRLMTQIQTISQKKKDAESTVRTCAQKDAELQKQIQEDRKSLHQAENALAKAEEDKACLEKYLEIEADVLPELLSRLSENTGEKQRLLREIETLKSKISQTNDQKRTAEHSLVTNRYDLQAKKNEQQKYTRADSFDPCLEETAYLAAQYQTLTEKTSGQSRDLLAELERLKQESEKKRRQFETYGIDVSFLKDIQWSSEEVELLRKQQEKIQQEIDLHQNRKEEADKAFGKLQAEYEAAERKLRAEGLNEPLPDSEIRMHFEERILEKEHDIKTAGQQIDRVQRQYEEVQYVLDQLNSLPDLRKGVSHDVTISEAIKEQYRMMRSEYDSAALDTKQARADYLSCYRKLKDIYQNKGSLFQKLYRNASVIEMKEYPSLQEIHAWKETCQAHSGTLRKNLDYYNTELEALETGIRQMIHSITTYTKRLCDALRQISRQSQMRLADRSAPVRLLRIEIHDDPSDAAQHMDSYLREGMARLAGLYEDKSSELDGEINSLLNSRRMITVYLDQQMIPVKVYRFDENSSHSGPVGWEKATRSNSTGEHSTSCFVIIATMMAYARGTDPELEDMRKERYEVIICDNPFASISSEYLVRPLITIVDQLHLQLISFTHNTQQSIADSFDVVIQLRNTALKSGKNRINIETERVSEEQMEHASLFSGAKQLSMF